MGSTDENDYYSNECFGLYSNKLPFVKSIYQVPLIAVLYLLLILKILPSYMKHRKPYELKTTTRVYNIVQVFLNGYVSYTGFKLIKNGELSLHCDVTQHETVSFLLWLGMILKILDLLDTIMFSLKKKYNQISFLHVYHHTITLIIWWSVVKCMAVGMSLVPGIINCFVHVVMYLYYFFSTFTNFRGVVLKVKPFVTILQLVQFIILLTHISQAFLPSCGYSNTYASIVGGHTFVNLCLFINFYRSTYIKKRGKKE